MFKIIDSYIARNVMSMVTFCTLGLVALSSLIKFVDQLRNVGKGDFDMTAIALFVMYTVPGQIVMFFPLGVLLGTVLALGNLAQSSELIVMQSLGKSRLSIVFSACKGVMLLIVLVMLLGEYVAPITEIKSDNVYTEATTEGQLAVTNSGIWFKEGNDFINIHYVFSDGTLGNVVRYRMTEKQPHRLLAVGAAQKGEWDHGKWLMKNVRRTRYHETSVESDFVESEHWTTVLSPEKLEVVGLKAADLSIRGLLSYISYMQENGQKSDKYQLELYRKLISPLMILVVLLLAASTIFGPLRSATMGARVVTGIIVGFIFYAINEILAPFSIYYGTPPMLGAAIPTIVAFLIAVYLLRRSS